MVIHIRFHVVIIVIERAFQIDDRQVVLFKNGFDFFKRVSIAVLFDIGFKAFFLSPIPRVTAQSAVPGKGDDYLFRGLINFHFRHSGKNRQKERK